MHEVNFILGHPVGQNMVRRRLYPESCVFCFTAHFYIQFEVGIAWNFLFGEHNNILHFEINFNYVLWGRVTECIATLGSILNSELSWESGKSKLARWSHNVALFSKSHPPTHPTHSLRNRPAAHLFSDIYINWEAWILLTT